MATRVTERLRDATQLRRRRDGIKGRYKDLFGRLERLFFEHDPIGISYSPDEYDPEVERLLPKLERIRTERELTSAIHSIFEDMFSPEIAGPRRKYEPIARDVWRLVHGHPGESPERSAAKR